MTCCVHIIIINCNQPPHNKPFGTYLASLLFPCHDLDQNKCHPTSMSCFSHSRVDISTDNKIKLIRKMVDSLTLQLKRAPFHVMSDVITLTISDKADFVELYVVDPDAKHVSLMSQQPQQDQEAYPSYTTLDTGTKIAEIVRTRQNVILKPGDVYPDRDYKTGMAVPWLQQSAVEGLVLVLSKTATPFTPNDLLWLHLLSAIVNTFSLSTKVSSEIRKNRRSSVVPDFITKSSLQLQHYQSTAKPAGSTEMQDTRILE